MQRQDHLGRKRFDGSKIKNIKNIDLFKIEIKNKL
jgi:hypothetical protein